MSKSAYHFCHKYNKYIDKLNNTQAGEKIPCDKICKECEYNDIIWVEEDD